MGLLIERAAPSSVSCSCEVLDVFERRGKEQEAFPLMEQLLLMFSAQRSTSVTLVFSVDLLYLRTPEASFRYRGEILLVYPSPVSTNFHSS